MHTSPEIPEYQPYFTNTASMLYMGTGVMILVAILLAALKWILILNYIHAGYNMERLAPFSERIRQKTLCLTKRSGTSEAIFSPPNMTQSG